MTSNLIKKRGSIKARLKIFRNFLDKLEPEVELSTIQRAELEARLTKFESLQIEYDEIQLQLECLSDNPDEQYSERDDFESKFYQTIAEARTYLNVKRYELKSGSPSSSEAGSVVDCNKCKFHKNPFKVRLPTISLPKFDGTFQNWLEFRDTFISLVHENNEIESTISKFHYLRACLQGEAATLISSLEITTANYIVAWDLLRDRYDNNRLLVSTYVKALFEAKLSRENSKDLRALIDTFTKNLRSLQILGESTQEWGTLLIHIVTNKLDSITNKEWEKYRGDLKQVTYETLTNFLKNKADLLETLESRTSDKNIYCASTGTKFRGLVISDKSYKKIKCYNCSRDHFIYNCEEFLKLSISERNKRAASLNLCVNCLQIGHTVNRCMRGHCSRCKYYHNTLLHSDDKKEEFKYGENAMVSLSTNVISQVLLSTATVKTFDKSNNCRMVRVLLDSGSTSCFITEKLSNMLNIDTTMVNSSVIGINNNVSSLTKQCTIRIQSHDGTYEAYIDCYIIPQITEPLPAYHVLVQDLNIPANVKLADTCFSHPGDIDILIGADIFWKLIKPGKIKLGKHQPTLQETSLGWVMTGSAINTQSNKYCHVATLAIQDQFIRFKELDKVGDVRSWSEDKEICESIFKTTTDRRFNGHFVVQLPLNQNGSELGNSFKIAKKKKKRLQRVFQEYERLQYMTEVSNNDNVRSSLMLRQRF